MECASGISQSLNYVKDINVVKVFDTQKQHLKQGAVFLARPAGFEPATYRFVAGHSIR